MQIPLKLMLVFSALVVGFSGQHAVAQESETAGVDEAALGLFAVEIKIGPNWDASKAPNEQAFFKEHSANLKRLRGEGHIVMEQDPSMTAGTFVYEVHAFNVFYPGLVQSSTP